MIPTTPLLERLRDDTREALVHLEGLPLWAALKDGTLPRESYVLFLEAMHAVHEPLREPLGGQPDPRVTAFWDAMAARIPLLEEDLTYLQRDRPGRTTESLLHAIMLSEETVLRGRRDPASLAGFLYVLHTSPLGDSLLAPLLSQPYGLPGTEGLAFVQGSALAQQAWGPFAEALQASTLDRDGQARAVDAALEAMEGLERIAEQLHPLVLEDDPDTLGHVLNPGAGRHVVAEDPRELRAALRAGVRSWERFPYYERRYGRRGRRFTRSDSAWLVTLASLPQSEVDRQIRWLGQVLAARGMPRWMLELHLEVLHEELVLSVPEAGDAYAPLLSAARHLRDQRHSVLEERVWGEIGASFDAAVGSRWARQLPGIGGLLVAAVADEALGVRHAVSSLEGWLTDPGRFPPAWATAVRQTLDQAWELVDAARPGLSTGSGA